MYARIYPSIPLIAVAIGAAVPTQAFGASEKAARDFALFMEQVQSGPLAPPGAAVIVFSSERTLFARAFGVRDARTRKPLTLDVPMYNGSVTKAYTGVLAAVLDDDGTLPLASTLSDTWPQLRLNAPLDAKKITAAQLLSHVGGMKAPPVEWRNTWVGRDDPLHYAGRLATYAIPTEGFVYQNFGPNTWSMMAEQRTGQTWSALLRSRVLAPLALHRTSGRLEDFGAASVSRCHVREDRRWAPQRPKPTATMTAAGGMYASPNDTARFLRAIMTDGRSAGGKIPAKVLRRTWRQTSVQDKDILGMHRDGYGLGWDLGTIAGHRFVARSGDYPGCAAMILTVPDLDLGIVVLINGDLAPSAYRKAVVAQAIDAWSANDEGTSARAAARIAELRKSREAAAAQVDGKDPVLRTRPMPAWARGELPGHYHHASLGTFRLYRAKSGLRLAQGVFDQPLRWADADRLLVRMGFGIEPVTLVRDAQGRVVAVEFLERRLERLAS